MTIREHLIRGTIRILPSLKRLTFDFFVYGGPQASEPFVWIAQMLEKIYPSNQLQYVTLKCTTRSHVSLAEFDKTVSTCWSALDNVLGRLHLRSVFVDIRACNCENSPLPGILKIKQYSPLLESQGILQVKHDHSKSLLQL